MITADDARKIYASSTAQKESVLSTLNWKISNASEIRTFITIDMFLGKCKIPHRGASYIENVSEALATDIFQTLKDLGYDVTIEMTNENDQWLNRFTIKW